MHSKTLEFKKIKMHSKTLEFKKGKWWKELMGFYILLKYTSPQIFMLRWWILDKLEPKNQTTTICKWAFGENF